MSESTASLCTANRVLKLLRREAAAANINAEELLEDDLKGLEEAIISEVLPLLCNAETEKMNSFREEVSMGIIKRMDSLREAIQRGDYVEPMITYTTKTSAVLGRVKESLSKVLASTTDHPSDASEISDLLNGLGNEVRDAKNLIVRLERIITCSSAIRDYEKKMYHVANTRDHVKRFSIIYGDAKKLMDELEKTISAFSFHVTTAEKNRPLPPERSGDLPEEEIVSARNHAENMNESDMRSRVQGLGLALTSHSKMLMGDTVSTRPQDKASEIRSWLRRLGEALDQAENLLDRERFGVSRSDHSGGGCQCCCFVNIINNNNNKLPSSSTTVQVPIAKGLVDPSKLYGVRSEVDTAVEKGCELGLGNGRTRSVRGGEEVRFDELFVYLVRPFNQFLASRKQDKRNILELMFYESEDRVEVFHLIDRGIVKTALSRDVFVDERVESYFDVRIWMSLGGGGELFSDKKVKELIVVSSRCEPIVEMDISSTEAVNLIYDLIAGTRYLLVLDDLSCDLSHNLDYLCFFLEEKESSARGSRILVTSNDKTLLDPSSMGFSDKVQVYDIQSTSEEDSWSLFVESYLKRELDPGYLQTIIGKEIAKSYQVQQLSAEEAIAIGAVFYFVDSEAERRSLYKDELMPLMNDQEWNYFYGYSRFLKFAYDQLPLNLKQCFDYCSLFPRGHEFDVQTLIQLWVAQGFTESLSSSSDSRDDLDEVGYAYFLNLLMRFFFDEVKLDIKGHATKCRLQYLMNQLKYYIGGSISHFVLGSDAFPSNDCFGVRTRSILFPTRLRKAKLVRDWDWNLLISECRFLRALDMHGFSIEKVPNSIGDLKHLRYLDLSENDNLVKLPKSITVLLNLQTLKLSRCSSLIELPEGFGYLEHLRHLETDGCNSLTSLPKEFGGLTNLRTLSQVILSKEDSKAKDDVEELLKLGQLREVRIKNLRHEMHGYWDSFRELRCLSLEWESGAPTDEEIKKNFPKHFNLDELYINGCHFVNDMFPFSQFPKLVKLHLKRCVGCHVLPPLDGCDDLKMLVLDEMLDLEYISENYSERVCESLQEVWLTELPKLKGWWKTPTTSTEEERFRYKFSRLSKLVIEDCPSLSSILLFPTLEEGLVLDSTSWEPFQQTVKLEKDVDASSSSSSPLSKLKNLCIVAIDDFDISKADEIKWTTLQNLEMLKLDFLPQLKKLPEELQHVTTLRELHIWRCGMNEIPIWIARLEALRRLVIRVCPDLKSLPEEIGKLKSLKILEIEDCQTLLRRCEEEIGADWYKICHIPVRRLGRISRVAG